MRPDVTHRLLTCPTVADIWNDVEHQVAIILDKHYTTSDAVNTTHCRAKQISASYTLSTLGQPPSAHSTPSNSTLQKISLMMAHEETRRATHHIREEHDQAQNTKRTQIAQSKADLLAFQAHLRTILHATHTAVAECLTILGEIPARDTHGKIIAEMTLRRHLPLSCADMPVGTYIAMVGTERRVAPRQGAMNKRTKLIHTIQSETCVQFVATTDLAHQDHHPAPSGPPIHHFLWWGMVALPPPHRTQGNHLPQTASA